MTSHNAIILYHYQMNQASCQWVANISVLKLITSGRSPDLSCCWLYPGTINFQSASFWSIRYCRFRWVVRVPLCSAKNPTATAICAGPREPVDRVGSSRHPDSITIRIIKINRRLFGSRLDFAFVPRLVHNGSKKIKCWMRPVAIK